MDVLSQLQEHTNYMASLLFNHIGNLQNEIKEDDLALKENVESIASKSSSGDEEDKVEEMAISLINAAKLFDLFVDALPLAKDSETIQVNRLAELQAENDALGIQLAEELRLANKELLVMKEMFESLADDCFFDEHEGSE